MLCLDWRVREESIIIGDPSETLFHRRPPTAASSETPTFSSDTSTFSSDTPIFSSDTPIFLSKKQYFYFIPLYSQWRAQYLPGVSTADIGVSDENIGVSDENIGVSDENIGVSDKNNGGLRWEYWSLRLSARWGLRWVSDDNDFFPDSWLTVIPSFDTSLSIISEVKLFGKTHSKFIVIV